MLTTPLTACPAMRVKSGAAGAATAGAGAGRGAWSGGAGAEDVAAGVSEAAESDAVRILPVITSPAVNPATTKARATSARRSMDLGDVDAARSPAAGLWNRHGQETVLEISGHAFDVDRFRQHEGARESAVAAFHAVKLLAGHMAGRALAAYDHAALLGLNLDRIARQAR